jgi:hypothetical protein
MICLARKKRTAVYRQFVAAETAVPVIACAACMGYDDEKQVSFAKQRCAADRMQDLTLCYAAVFLCRNRPQQERSRAG